MAREAGVNGKTEISVQQGLCTKVNLRSGHRLRLWCTSACRWTKSLRTLTTNRLGQPPQPGCSVDTLGSTELEDSGNSVKGYRPQEDEQLAHSKD